MTSPTDNTQQGWQPIETAPVMRAIMVFHEYYSHGQVRHGFRGRDGNWRGVNADGTEGVIHFEPTAWQPLPAPPAPGASA